MAEWEDKVKPGQPEWAVVRPAVDDISTGGEKYILHEGRLLSLRRVRADQSSVKLTVKTDLQNITAFRLELLNDPNLPLGGPGRSIKGTGALTEFTVEAAPADDPAKVTKFKFAKAAADVDQPEKPLEPIFDDKSGKRRVTGPVAIRHRRQGRNRLGHRCRAGAAQSAAQGRLHPGDARCLSRGHDSDLSLAQNHGGWNSDDNQNNNLGRFRLSITDAPGATADPLPEDVRDILAIPAAERTPAQVQTSSATGAPRFRSGRWKTTRSRKSGGSTPKGRRNWCLRTRAVPRETHILTRGDFLKPAARCSPASRRFCIRCPVSWKNGQPTRLTFARWLAARDSPTTARSIVNRVWQAYFGTGIVATSENFGTQCEPPSHPELLDWLAVEFMDQGWSLKKLHRLIVTSATYRQSSKVTPELQERDPYNRLLARGPRFRVDAEMVRDIALSASGLLNSAVGGPSVFPPRPSSSFSRRRATARSPGTKRRVRPLSPGALHVPLPLGALPDAADLRRAQRRHVVRAARAFQYAAAGPDHAQRAGVSGSGAGLGGACLDRWRQNG